jgi:hypothetical protein
VSGPATAPSPLEHALVDCRASTADSDNGGPWIALMNEQRQLRKDMRRFASILVRTAREEAGWTFDYSERSIPLLDEYVDTLWPPDEPPSEKQMDEMALVIGAYLGEVMIRNVGGGWAFDKERLPSVTFDGETFGHPLAKAYKKQAEGPHHNFVQFYDFYKNELSAKPRRRR